MIITPMIGEYEISGIEHIDALERRKLVSVSVPGLAGDYLQDMGSASIAIHITGSLAGDAARDSFLEPIRTMHSAGDPVDFVADITTATEIEQVVIADLQIGEHAGRADTFTYLMVLVQYIPPPVAAAPGFDDLTDLNADIDLEAAGLFDLMQIPDLLGSVPDFGNPVPPLASSVDSFAEATSGISEALQGLQQLFGVSGNNE